MAEASTTTTTTTVYENGVPFSETIMADTPPPHLSLPLFSYDGTTDPWEHICRFENHDLLFRYTHGVKCLVFLTTLTGYALRWFQRLPPRSIHSFAELSAALLDQFRFYRKKRTPQTLMLVKQMEGESMRSYVRRFSEAALELTIRLDEESLVFAFEAGVWDKEPYDEVFYLAPQVKSYGDLMDRVERLIRREEARENFDYEGRDCSM